MKNIRERQKKDSFHFDARFWYEHVVQPIIYSNSGKGIFAPNVRYAVAESISTPEKLAVWQSENSLAIADIRTQCRERNIQGSILGFCARTFINISDCGLKDLDGFSKVADKKYPPCSIFWGLQTTNDNGDTFIRPHQDAITMHVAYGWGKYIILPPEENPASELLVTKA